MKKKILMLSLAIASVAILTGCGKSSDTQVEEVTPTAYTDEASMPSDTFYIVRSTKKGKTYYPVFNAERTFSDANEEATGADPTRVMWVNKDVNEGKIPTMRKDDILIYKSSTSIPTQYSLEKFFDNGYTFGVLGLYKDASGKYRYDGNNGGYVMSKSDAVGMDSLEADSIYFASYKDKKKDVKIDPSNVSTSGTIMGLKEGKTYDCDIRTGTEKLSATLTANIHYFASAETYMFGEFDFITEHVAKINVPEYMTTGYYNINGCGMFRYIADDSKEKNLKAKDYNSVIYSYNQDGSIDGTSIGYVFDENGYLVKESSLSADSIQPEDYTYDGTDAAGSNAGTFKITQVEPGANYSVDDNSGQYFDFAGINTETNDIVGFRMYVKTGSNPITIDTDKDYYITYKNDDGSILDVSDTYTKVVLDIKEAASADSAEKDAE